MDWDLRHRLWDYRRVAPAALRNRHPFIQLVDDVPELTAAISAIAVDVREFREAFFVAAETDARLDYAVWAARRIGAECRKSLLPAKSR